MLVPMARGSNPYHSTSWFPISNPGTRTALNISGIPKEKIFEEDSDFNTIPESVLMLHIPYRAPNLKDGVRIDFSLLP